MVGWLVWWLVGRLNGWLVNGLDDDDDDDDDDNDDDDGFFFQIQVVLSPKAWPGLFVTLDVKRGCHVNLSSKIGYEWFFVIFQYS